ncbi:HNH endonuclease [Marinobacter nitratireducens]|uniref:HNH endonuclease n=1 Tax=Marinobacter nitratireducens TaxID=1137280 RepID=UPI00056C2247|nr:HNH endonuclease [Marinobacter nitratireducens]
MSTGFAVITENDESKWDDETGVQYHDPHYFAVAEISSIERVDGEQGGELIAHIDGYREFSEAVLHKVDGEPLEEIPEKQKSNYWRRSVRDISQAVFEHILSKATSLPLTSDSGRDGGQGRLTSTSIEGKKKVVYSTVYERDSNLRAQAIEIHGLTCKACGFNFGETYGPYGKGLIHIHHIRPLFEAGEAQYVNPETDLVPLCANCHTIVHRRRNRTLTVDEVKSLIQGKEIS